MDVNTEAKSRIETTATHGNRADKIAVLQHSEYQSQSTNLKIKDASPNYVCSHQSSSTATDRSAVFDRFPQLASNLRPSS